MISVFVFALVLGILIIVHEFGHFISARRLGIKVEEFSWGFGPTLLKKKKGDTVYSINLVPFGGYVKLAGDSIEGSQGASDEYLSKTPGERAQVIFCGPLLNYVLGFLCFWVILFSGYPTLTSKVGSVIEGYGAMDAGVQEGDAVTSVDGVKVSYWDDLQKEIRSKKDAASVQLILLRGGKEMSVEVKLKQKEVTDMLGQKQSAGLVGIAPSDETVEIRHGFLESFVLSGQKVWDLTVLTYKAFWFMITGKMSVRESVTGPLGIFYITHKAASLGIIPVLHLIAVLSISLGIFNLLPLPVLDGGYLFLLLLEKIRRKSISAKSERVMLRIGMTMLITMAVLVTYNDILRFGDKIGKWFFK